MTKVLELFKYGIEIKSWGEVYLGLLKNWITPEEILEYSQEGRIHCNQERFVELYLAHENSLVEFLELIKSYLEKDDAIAIEINEDTQRKDFSKIPKRYWRLWEVEFLLKVVNLDSSKEEKLYNVEPLYAEFNHPQDWHDFLYYMPAREKSLGINGLYENLQNYLEIKIKEFKTS